MKIGMRLTWILALAAAMMGCSSSVGGSAGGGDTVGDLIAKPDRIEVSVNLADGFAEPVADDKWNLDAVSCTLALNGGAPVSLTAAKCDELIAAVTSAEYRVQPDCMGMAIDGAPMPPRLTVSAGDASQQLGVSDAKCAESDHSAKGNVIGCDDFGSIYALLEAAAPSGRSFSCAGYW